MSIPNLGNDQNFSQTERMSNDMLQWQNVQSAYNATRPICYKISHERVESWLDESSMQDPNYELIGLQFNFKGSDGPLDEIFIEQVYINFSTQDLEWRPVAESNFDIPNEAYAINTDPVQAANNQHIEPLNTNEPFVHKRLEFYDETNQVDYVFFTIDKLIYLKTFYTELYLSGCQVRFGSKPGSSIIGATHFDGLSFSLKLEGKSPEEIGTGPNDPAFFRAAGVFLGAACPPTWYAFQDIIMPNFASLSLAPEDIRKLYYKISTRVFSLSTVHN